MKKNKRSKFGAIKTIVDGIMFDSKLEARRYRQLVLLEKAKEISDLKLQVPYPLRVTDCKYCKAVGYKTYIADFVYTEKGGRVVVEDAKGPITSTYRKKRKLMKMIYGIEIYEWTGK